MKRLFILPAVLLCQSFLSGGVVPDFINPTGTYRLAGNVKKNHVLGHSGELRAELLDSSKIAISFSINKGYPNYESGSMTDTLFYDENMARYTPACDSSCTIIFWFTPNAVELKELFTADPHSGCGFAKGVMAA